MFDPSHPHESEMYRRLRNLEQRHKELLWLVKELNQQIANANQILQTARQAPST